MKPHRRLSSCSEVLRVTNRFDVHKSSVLSVVDVLSPQAMMSGRHGRIST